MPPIFRRKQVEDALADPAGNLAEQAELRPQKLTQELLDWLIAALEAVLVTPELRDYANRRAVSSLRDALKYADHLYPMTLEEADASGTAESGGLHADPGTFNYRMLGEGAQLREAGLEPPGDVPGV